MLTIKFLDIGLGTSALIKTDKINIIFDCGQDNKTGNNAFKELKDEPVHYLIFTHPHKDHIESLISLDYRNPLQIKKNNNIPNVLIDNQINKANNEYDKEIFRRYKRLNQRYTNYVSNEKSYNNPRNNGGITIKHFIPSEKNSDDLNDYSIATYLYYNGFKILLMGDNTQRNIDELMNDYNTSEIENIDVLLAPHHGRESCYNYDFVKYVNPRITIISDKPEDNNESASDKYGDNSRGMYISKNGKREFRSCITTRNDGNITLTIDDSNNFSINCIK